MRILKGLYAIAIVGALSLPMAAQSGGWHIPNNGTNGNGNGTWSGDRDDDRDHDRDRDRDHDRDDRWHRDRDRDWDRDRWRDRDRDRYGRYNNIAYRNGFNAGVNEGQRDRSRNKKFKYGKDYKHSDNGYRSEYGDKNRYRQEYQRGYADGYSRGYNSGGWNAGNSGGWHIPGR